MCIVVCVCWASSGAFRENQMLSNASKCTLFGVRTKWGQRPLGTGGERTRCSGGLDGWHHPFSSPFVIIHAPHPQFFPISFTFIFSTTFYFSNPVWKLRICMFGSCPILEHIRISPVDTFCVWYTIEVKTKSETCRTLLKFLTITALLRVSANNLAIFMYLSVVSTFC